MPEELAEFEVGQTDWFQGIYPSDVANVREQIDEALKGSPVVPFDYRMVTERRGIVWVRHWIDGVSRGDRRDFAGGVSGFVQVLDEQKLLEAECLRICEREKTAIGQELHDDVCQLLVGLSCMLEAIGKKAKTAMPEMAPTFDDLASQLSAGMERTRSLAHSLVPMRLINMGLPRALRELASQAQRNFNIKVHVSVARSLPSQKPEQILHVYRIAQEAIGNAFKHGRATEIEVELTRQRNKMNLSIRDNGSGIPAEASRKQGIGLHIMSYRAAAIGGRCTISSQPNKGSVVSITYDCVGAAKRVQKVSA
ncbi:MAG TPA: PAS domain-containing sensor histidine kinase [Opitutaceae bacterium]|nr:PAS domain-containing sensor histidine kinase [Opitutaceae bacterium]